MSFAKALDYCHVFDKEKNVKLMPADKLEILVKCRDVPEAIRQTQWKNKLFGEISKIMSECGNKNWDDEGAIAVSSKYEKIAKDFIQELKSTSIEPEVFPVQNGSIGFSWYSDTTDTVLSVMFDNDKIAYASTIEGQKGLSGNHTWEGAIPLGLKLLLDVLPEKFFK